MDVTFDSVTVKTKQGRELLSNVGGSAFPGTFTSLMGASGSGKTTLLTTLSRRFEGTLQYSGNIRYGGRKFTKADRRAIAFVQQDDIVPAYLTVFEHLDYSSRLRLHVTDQARKERVEKVISQLKLEKCRNTLLGGVEARGVSGGERKRASIANELLTEPKVLLTDEVTSGLDSTMSSVVIDILKDLARTNNLTVITTIHSPSSSIFERFDNLLVLDEGKIFYRGLARDLIKFLNDTLGRSVPPMFNPADFLMDILVLEKDVKRDDRVLAAIESFTTNRHDTDASKPRIEEGQNPNLAHRRTSSYRSTKKLMRNVSVLFRPGQEANLEDDHVNKFAQPFHRQVMLLTGRLWRRYRRDLFTVNQVGSTLGLALISGLLFFQLGYSEAEIFSRVALALWLVGTDMYLSVFSTVWSLHDDVPLLKKELYDGSYSLAAHFVAKQITLYPANGLWSVVFCTLVLLSTRLAPSVGAAVLAILTVQAEVFLFQGVGFLISAGVPVSGLVVVSVVAVTYFFAFNGFFSPFALMAPWYGWLRWTCFLTYSYQLVMQIVFPEYPTFDCAKSPAISAYSTCNDVSGVNDSRKITGLDVLEHYDVDMSVATCISVLLAGGVFFRLMSYLVYVRKMTPPKGINEDDQQKNKFRRYCCRRGRGSAGDSSKNADAQPAEQQSAPKMSNCDKSENATVVDEDAIHVV